MLTIADKTYLTASDESVLTDYAEVAFTSYTEAKEFTDRVEGKTSKGLFLLRDIFPHTPGYDRLLAYKGVVAVGLFAPIR